MGNQYFEGTYLCNKIGESSYLKRKIHLFVLAFIMITTWSANVFAQQGGLNLDGNGDYATATNGPSLDISGKAITLEAWVKHDGNSNKDAVIIEKGYDSGGYELSLSGDGDETYVRFAISNINGNDYPTEMFSKNGVPANRWTHIAATYNGNFMKIYINGQLESTMQETADIGSNNYDLYIGSNSSTAGQFFSGIIDEISIWNTSRTVTQINNDYLIGLTGSETGLVSYYKFSSVSGSTISDMSGSNALGIVGDAGVSTPGVIPVAPDLYAHNGNGSVSLNWDERIGPSSDNKASLFKLYRSTQLDGSDRTEVATIDGGTTNYTDTDVSNDQTYYYQITAIDGSGNESDYSPIVTATPYNSRGGGSLELNKNAYGLLTDRPSLDISNHDITIQAWIKHDGNSDPDAVIVSKGQDSQGYRLDLAGQGEAPRIRFAVSNVAGNDYPTQLFSNSSIPAHQWTQVTATYDGQDMKIYINGKLDATTPETASIGENDFDLYVGSDPAVSNHFFSGNIDELAIWNVARTRTQIESSYNKELTGNENGLKLYFRFDDAGNAVVRSMDTYHTKMEMNPVNGSIQLSSPGVYPVTPYSYAVGRDSQGLVSMTDRGSTTAAEHKVYRSGAMDLSDRAMVATLSSSTLQFTDTDISNESTYYYEATAINADGQESDYSRFDVARASKYAAGNAIKLDGDNDYVKFDDRNSLDGYDHMYTNYDKSITLEAWINHDGNSNANAIIIQKGTDSEGYLLRLDGSGNDVGVVFAISNIAGNDYPTELISNSNIPANTWTHVTATYDGSDMKIYINGQLDNTTSESAKVGANDNPLYIGAPSALNGQFYSGELDEIRIWNEARTSDQVAADYYQEKIGNDLNLIAYLRFNEPAESGVTYSSARRAMSGKLYGNATFTPSNALSSQPALNRAFTKVTLDEDFGTYVVAALDTMFQDADTPNLSYSISAPCHIVNAAIQSDTSLVLTSVDNMFGTDTLTVQASDGATTIKSSFILEIKSVNDVPQLAGFENTIKVPMDGSYEADMYARTADVESADTALVFHFAVDTTGINVNFDGQYLTLTRNGNFEGTANLSISVVDEGMDTTTVKAQVEVVKGTAIVGDTELPNTYTLDQNYPNPFNPSTNIKYALPASSDVHITIYNSIGRRVATLVDQKQSAGIHHVMFNADNLPTGIYFYHLRAGNFTQTRKMLLIK